MKPLILFLLALPIFAQPTALRVVSITPQQAIVGYTSPDSSACTLAVTDNSGLGITVWDVSNAKFANSNSDLSRSNTITWGNGLQRQIVLGARSAQVASDSKLYSRSLQANTAHTLTVTCTGGSASVNFSTANLPVGSTYPDPQPFNASGWGNAGWPTIDWSAAGSSTAYVDPKTGVSMRPATWWGRYGQQATGFAFGSAYDSSGTWTNAQNILSGNSSTLASSSNTNPIYLSLNKQGLADINGNIVAGGFAGYNTASGSASFMTIADIRINIIGNGTSATAADRQVTVCLYSHTGTCDTTPQTVTLNQSSTTTVSFPASSWPSAPFSGWGTKTWVHNLVSPFVATVNVSGTAVTSTATVPNDGALGKLFNTDLVAGDKVTINGTLATISAVTSPTTMTLVENLGTITGGTLAAANFGVKIAKVNSTGTVNLTTTYDTAFDPLPGFSIADGASYQCSKLTFNVTENASGGAVAATPAQVCVINAGDGISNSVHLLIPSTGEMRHIGLLKFGFGGGGEFGLTVSPKMPYDPFDETDPRTFYVMANSSANSTMEIARITYRGNGKDYGPQYVTTANAMWSPTDGETTCNAGEVQSGNMCMQLVTPPASGKSIYTQIAAADARYSTGMFGNSPQIVQILGGNAILFFNVSQDAATMFTYFNLSTGNLVWVGDTFTTPGTRWGAMHTASAWTSGTRHAAVINTLGRNGATGPMIGPYSTAVSQLWSSTDGVSGTWGVPTFNSSYSYPCPAGVCATGAISNTLRFRLAGTPCNTTPGVGELATYPCPWNASYSAISTLQVGDLIGNCAQQTCKSSELFLVLRIIQNSPTDWDVWTQRGANSPTQSQQGDTDPWSMTAFPSGACNTAMWWYDSTGANKTIFTDNCAFVSGSHFDIVTGPTTGKYTFTTSLQVKYATTANQAGYASAPGINLGGFGSWQGLLPSTNFPGNGNIEEYPSIRQFPNAPASEKVWQADYRGILSGTFGSTNGGGQAITGNTLSQVVTGGRTKVWKFLSPYTPQPKKLPMEAFAGHWYFQDVSGPGSNILDASLWKYCVVYATGECISGSATTVGDVYFAAPNVVNLNDGACYTNQYDSQLPCFVPASPIGNWNLQWDISQQDTSSFHFRRLSQAFVGSARVTNGPNWRPSPDGKWGLTRAFFVDGVSPIMWNMTIPPWPGYDGIRRDFYQPQTFKLGSGAALAEIRFGYEENGTTSQFYCTSRLETCVSRSDSNLFNYITSDGHSGTSCTSGCSISVPSVSGRILWWQEWRSSDGGTTWAALGTPQPVTVK